MKNISIVIPVFNAENTIERVLASLISNKDFIHEVILVNDRSNDNTFSKIENFKTFFDIKVINNQGIKGPGPARKTGLLAATGEWITFVDADDCLTANSLYYVAQQLNNTDMVLLHSKTIYYESGNFIAKHIEYSDTSCGGNFYKRDFLIQNNLFPHDTLYMAEDEYFNEIILTFIEYCTTDKNVGYFDYPVYEVHHDTDIELSFAHSNWSEYICKYHLLYKIKILEFFKDNELVLNQLKEPFQNHIVFSYYLIQGILSDTSICFDKNFLKYFYDAIMVFCKTYNETEQSIIEYYTNMENTHSYYKSAVASIGFDFRIKVPFDIFIQSIIKMYGPLA